MTAFKPGAQRRLVLELANAGVDFILIGGHAVAAHGYERATRDVDIVFSTSQESCRRLASVLTELGASVEFADLPDPSGDMSGGWLAGGGHFRLATDAGPLDALSSAAGLDYATLASRAVTAEIAGSIIRVCSYEDLVAMKRSGGRQRDLQDLEELEDLQRS